MYRVSSVESGEWSGGAAHKLRSAASLEEGARACGLMLFRFPLSVADYNGPPVKTTILSFLRAHYFYGAQQKML